MKFKTTCPHCIKTELTEDMIRCPTCKTGIIWH